MGSLIRALMPGAAMPSRPADSGGQALGGALRVDGQLRTIAELRSAWSKSAVAWLGRPDEGAVEYDNVSLARAYQASMTAFVCINVRAGIDSEIPLVVVGESGAPIYPSPADSLIAAAGRTLWQSMAALLIWGSCYLLKIRNVHGFPTAVRWLSPLDVRPDLDWSAGRVAGYHVKASAGEQYLPASEMIAHHTFDPFTEIEGTSALAVAMLRADVELNISRYAAAFFRNSARPDIVLTYNGPLNEQERSGVRRSWDALFKGAANGFRTAILGGDWKITPLEGRNDNLAMADLADQNDAKIAAAFGVNPALAGLGRVADALSAQSTYRQVRQHHLEFVAVPDVRRWCDALNSQWLHADFPGQRWTLAPDTSAILSEALGGAERIAAANSAAGRLWMVSEARAHTGRPPLTGVIERDPTWEIAAFQAGLVTQAEARRSLQMGAPPPTGYIWDVDPRATAASITPPLGPLSRAPTSASAAGTLNAEGDFSKPPTSMAADQHAALHEIGQWARRVKSGGRTARFTTEVLPPAVGDYVRQALQSSLPTSEIWSAVRAHIRDGVALPPVPTEDEAAAYWQDFDALLAEVGLAWLNDYMAAAWAQIEARITPDMSDAQILNALEVAQVDLEVAWTGSAEVPGPMLKLALAGMAAGQRQLERAAKTLAQRADPRLIIQIDWARLSAEALQFIQRYLPTLIRNINLTTMQAVRQAIEAWLVSGSPLTDLADTLQALFTNRRRAELIAQTEGTRLFAEGSAERYRRAGVRKARWLTARDEFVCDVCRPLHDQIADLSVGWPAPGGSILRPPAHPGCRCGIRPVLSDEDTE
jgi:HK97 family phage portal protein